MSGQPSSGITGRRWSVRGQVQGVGFRPFVYRMAVEHGLVGVVRNEPGGVVIEAWGAPESLRALHEALTTRAPDLARVDSVAVEEIGPGAGVPASFEIARSAARSADPGRVTVDVATCRDCLRELFEQTDRRCGHALINCTNCGPRYTIVRGLPYDRALTTMAGFAMCDRCAGEYADPLDRRFHAQPICCSSCGPRVTLRSPGGGAGQRDPFAAAAGLLRQGRVVAIKGVGGYHLAVDAGSEAAVAELRRRKRRDGKPFALMVRGLEEARDLVRLTPAAEAALASPAAPIVLGIAREDRPTAPSVAPRLHRLGVMLPSTPMQHLLFDQGLGPLVMTSANASDDPLVIEDAAVWEELGGVFDAVLAHDRPIERAVDDSVLLDAEQGLVPLRRARGYVPTPLPLPVGAGEPGLCLGAELKNTVAVVRRGEAILSQHVGDLSRTLAYTRFVRSAEDLLHLFEVRPRWVACDAHPAYLSRRHALGLGAKLDVPVYEVQHHHAHLASLLAEHGRRDRVIGLVCDGVGYGDDGTAWGGEVLVGDLASYERVGRLRPLRLPGGDAAAKEVGRCGLSWLWDGLGEEGLRSPHARRTIPDDRGREAVAAQLRRGLHCPPSSGMGRLFDACAALLGVCDRNHYEAMSGQVLEAAAWRGRGTMCGEGLVRLSGDGRLLELDHRGLLLALIEGLERGESVERLAWQFHDALSDALVRAAAEVARRTGIRTVGLTGGVFCNDVLTKLTVGRLAEAGLEALLHRSVPPNDGGLSYGQAAAVGAMMERQNG